MGETQENSVTLQNGYHPSLKTNEDVESDGESVMGVYKERPSKQG